jgi:phosphoglycolate phosphatase-like HAD superfamily hydrolase
LSVRHRVVLFDIDNTLLDSGGAGRRALERAVLEATGIRSPLARVPFAGRTDPAILRDILAQGDIAPEPGRLASIFARYLAFLEEEVAGGRSGRVLPGVEETLAALEGRPLVHAGVLTGNIAPGARIKLRPFGLDRRFPFGAFGDDAPTRPALLPVALERWRRHVGDGCGLSMRDVFVVGDTVHDVEVAKAHGARAVAVGTGRQAQPREALLALAPDFFFEDLTEARPFLEEVLRDA